MAGECRRRRTEMQALGMCRIVVEDGKVTEVGEPRLKYCPLFNKMLGIEEIDSETVRKNLEYRVKSFGFGTEERVVRAGDYVTFGVSEILSTAVKDGRLDGAVIAADGCGSAVLTDPELIQGLCGRISGMVSTDPLDTVLDAVGRDRVVDPDTTPMDQVRGAELAMRLGLKRFAVTVCRPEDSETIRRMCGDRAVIIAVHTSCVSEEGAQKFYANCDFLTACASRVIREIAYSRPDVVIAGNKIPIIAVTDIGKELVLSKLKELGKEPWDRKEPTVDPKPWL
ncbi:MAG: methanogenesis marker 8 protein [Methanomethylophilus sp.]|nr:methanogenesis marker 8 protein [Methanomethylophilus sp.]